MNRTRFTIGLVGLLLALGTASGCVVRASGHIRTVGVVAYEAPPEPDLVIAAHEHPVEESVALLIEHLTARGLAGTSTAAQPSAEYA